MQITHLIEQIHSRQRSLVTRWESTRQIWNDPVSQEFERACVQPLSGQVAGLLASLSALDAVLGTIDSFDRRSRMG